MPFLDDLDFPHTVVVTPFSEDLAGDKTSGTPFEVKAFIQGKVKLVRDSKGSEVVSNRQMAVKGNFKLTSKGHMFTLPDEFASPRIDVRAKAVIDASDEDGTLYQEVYL